MSHELMDLQIVALNKVYNRLALGTILQWVIEGRIAPDDRIKPAGAAAWQTVAEMPLLAARLPQGLLSARTPSGQPSVDDEAEQDVDDAAGWTVRRKKPIMEDAEMDMTPMIDVTFQLLIFFMLTNNLANSAPILLPEAKFGRGVTPEGRQMVIMTGAGQYYLGEQVAPENGVASLDELVSEIGRNAQAAESTMDVIVNGEKDVKYGQLRQLVEKLGGVPNVGRVLLGVEEAK